MAANSADKEASTNIDDILNRQLFLCSFNSLKDELIEAICEIKTRVMGVDLNDNPLEVAGLRMQTKPQLKATYRGHINQAKKLGFILYVGAGSSDRELAKGGIPLDTLG